MGSNEIKADYQCVLCHRYFETFDEREEHFKAEHSTDRKREDYEAE